MPCVHDLTVVEDRGTVGVLPSSCTTGSGYTRALATAPRPRRAPTWKGSARVRPRDVLIPPLHSPGTGPLEGADRGRGGAADRRAVQDRARDQRPARRGAPGGPEGAGRAPGAELEVWLRAQHARVSRKSEIGKAIAYALNHWEALTRFLEDGRICVSNNAAERALRGVAVGRRSWTFAGSERPATRCCSF